MVTAPITAGQMKDLSSGLVQAIPTDLPSKIAQDWIGRKGELADKIGMILNGCEIIPADINWPLAYEKLGMTAEYEQTAIGLVLPKANPGLWIVPMVHGITPNRVVAGYRKLKVNVNVYTYRDDLDTDVTKNDRDPNLNLNKDGAYLVGFCRTLEADEENANKSANDLARIKHKGIVLCEWLMLGFGYYVTTGQHLDVRSATLCTGSRNQDGYVPSVRWYPPATARFVSSGAALTMPATVCVPVPFSFLCPHSSLASGAGKFVALCNSLLQRAFLLYKFENIFN